MEMKQKTKESREIPTFSIIIATYQSGKTLEIALKSILYQSFQSWEIVIIDGGSSDSTLKIVEKYRENIKVWISEKDNGIYDAWNKGISYSSGMWVLFLGSDDELTKDSLQNYYDVIKDSSDIDYVSGKVELFNNTGKNRLIGKPWKWKEFKHYMSVAHVSSIHSKHYFEKFGKYNTSYKICGDYELLLRARSNLSTRFVDKIQARMFAGGVSNLNINALKETLFAKQNTKALKRVHCVVDYYIALFKWWLRRITGKI